MALSTTQSIWRSGGGDNTRTAYCGSGVMAAQFYIADASPAAANTNVKVSSASGAADLVLPAGAIVLSVSVTTAVGGSGTCDIGYKQYSNTSVVSSDYIANALSAAVGTTSIGSVVSGAALPNMSYVTVSDSTSAAGALTGYITYFVADPLVGQQNV